MNSSNGIFSKYERDELNKITAKSILEKLMNIRQNINTEFTARRLVWELIQNAKDNVFLSNTGEEKVDVSISISENMFTFSHNKGFFTNEHIRGLIRKYSSSDKNRDEENVGQIHKTTGRFGTGFMTTHLLSECVEIKSHYKNEDGNFHDFSFVLDRSGKTESKIIEGINQAFDDAEASIQASNVNSLSKDELKTSFIYPLTPQKETLANIALDEALQGIAYTLINVPEINSVRLDDGLFGDVKYTIEHFDDIEHDELNLQVFNLKMNGKSSKFYYLRISESDVQLIIPVSYTRGNYHIEHLDKKIPRLHLDFPMIGTEDLYLPFVVNSSLFEPTEPRDGVSLIDDEENDTLKLNCSIMVKAVSLYQQFLDFIGTETNWQDLYNLARVKNPKRHVWIDPDWFKTSVIKPIRETLLESEIVETDSGDRISILDSEGYYLAYFPVAANEGIQKFLFKLVKKIHPDKVPKKEHVSHWAEIIWSDCRSYSLTSLTEEIQEKGDLDTLGESLVDTCQPLSFLNDYYKLLNEEEEVIKEIKVDKYTVIPNQLGTFVAKTSLYIEDKIDEEIKNVCAMVGTDPRTYLIYPGALTGEGIKYYFKKQDDLIALINAAIKDESGSEISAICDYLVSLFPKKDIPEKRTKIFDLSERIYPDDFKEKRHLNYFDEKIWEESDKKSLLYIVNALSDQKNVETAREEYGFDNDDDFLTWLNDFVSFLTDYKFSNFYDREKAPILPDQNGNFKTANSLFLDEDDIGDVLKDISAELGSDFRAELLDVSIFLTLPENRTYGIAQVAERISTHIKPILRDVDLRKEYKTTLKKFYVWMSENKECGERHFPDLYEKRFLFLEDDDISSNMKKATEFEALMEEHGIENIDELRKKLASLSNYDNVEHQDEDSERIAITKEVLVSLGISTPDQLMEALKDPGISSRFLHTSKPTPEMYQYAHKLIDRAKINIKEFLENHPDYDCTDLEETAPTTFAGILKNGIEVQIVARPSDNGEVIVYYSSEKDTLDNDNAELWVENGITDPHLLTLGRILKSTGITKIPINMN
ncbi:hypothetical protein QWY86_10840 [Pedobacter aquatilis]|uniref:sacsin N-terminal ATP-binding-like domain-containing protein n=1 Tax=Pedobacter aquatilis TaxID=351343 RepID=UPI0025B46E87|nr:hypothetical protein [Pedobacter aquatilis]MDN3587167.1 hypothetical protein [Pedobacter aquatilis]